MAEYPDMEHHVMAAHTPLPQVRESVAVDRAYVAELESRALDLERQYAASQGELQLVITAALVWESDAQDSDDTEQALLEAVRTYRRRSETS